MFGSGQEPSKEKICRSDPEELLQERRAHKEKVDAALSAFKLVHASNLYIHGGEGESTRLIGALTIEQWKVELRIEQLLKEIDS